MADRNVKVVVRADVADFLRGAGLVSKATEDMATKATKAGREAKSGLSGMAQSVRENRDAFGTVGGALTAYGAAVTGITALVAKTGIEYNTLRQRSGAALTTLTGSAEAANAQMAKLDEFASSSPFARDVFIRAQQQMFGFGIEAQKVIPYLDAIQNAVAAAGGSNHDIAELSRIFSQISASSKITATDLREFGNRGIDAATIIGSQMGKTGAQIREDITAGTLDAGAALDALAAGMQDRFGGAADNVKNTMLGAVDRVKAAFRDLASSAMTPFVDPEGGGLAVDGLNRLADALRAFEDLPAGVRNTALGLGTLSGAAALFAGGALIAIPRMVDFYDALGKMGTQGRLAQEDLRRLPSVLGNVARAAAGATALLAVATAIQRIEQASWEAAPGVEEVTRALLDINRSGNQGQLDDLVASMEILGNGTIIRSEPIDTLADAIQRLDNPTAMQRVENLDKILPGVQTSGDRAAEALGAIDAALAQMANRGDVSGAQEALASALEGTGIAAETAMQYLPAFNEVLIGLENEAAAAAEATGTLAGTLIALPDGVPTKLEQMREGSQKLAQSIGEAADQFINLGDSIDDTEVSLDDWLNKLIEQANARDAWLGNMQTLLSEGLDMALYGALVEQGPAGALRVQQMVDDLAAGRDISEFNELGRRMADATVDEAATAIGEAVFPTVPIEAALDRAQLKEELNSAVMRAPEEVEAAQLRAELDLNDEKARVKTAETVLWAMEQTGIMNLDANSLDAHIRIDEWNALAENTEGMSKLNTNPELAVQELAAWYAQATDTVATAKLNADAALAEGKVQAWRDWAASLTAMSKTDTNVFPAQSSVLGLMGWIGQQWATVNVNARYAGGLNVGGSDRTRVSARAGGGVERQPGLAGPQYGRTNMILWGEPETRGEAFISNHPNYRTQNINYLRTAASWFGMDVVKAYAAGGVARYASSGYSSHAAPVTASVDSAQIAGAVAGALSSWRPMVRLGDRDFYGTMVRAEAQYADRAVR